MLQNYVGPWKKTKYTKGKNVQPYFQGAYYNFIEIKDKHTITTLKNNQYIIINRTTKLG